MSNFDDFFGGGGGGPAIGDLVPFQEAGDDFTEGGRYFLRSGKLATAASYPLAAVKERCKVSGVPSTTIPTIASFAATQIADNGSGTYVICYGDATNVLVSTNGGVTLTQVAHGLSRPAVAVVWTGTRFIIAGNDATTLITRYSTNGTAWSAGSGLSSSSMGANSIRGAHNGTIALFVAKNNVTACFTTSDGVTLTQRTLPSVTQTNFVVAGNGSYAGTFLLGANFSGSVFTTTTGASFTTVALNFPLQTTNAACIGGTWMFLFSNQSLYYTSTNLSTYTQRKINTSATLNVQDGVPVTNDGTRVYLSTAHGVAWTTDGIAWYFRFFSSILSASSWIYWKGLAVTNGTSPLQALIIASFTNADYVGFPIPSSGFSQVMYSRLS